MKYHTATHSRETLPHPCKICDKEFDSHKALKMHLRKHNKNNNNSDKEDESNDTTENVIVIDETTKSMMYGTLELINNKESNRIIIPYKKVCKNYNDT